MVTWFYFLRTYNRTQTVLKRCTKEAQCIMHWAGIPDSSIGLVKRTGPRGDIIKLIHFVQPNFFLF